MFAAPPATDREVEPPAEYQLETNLVDPHPIAQLVD